VFGARAGEAALENSKLQIPISRSAVPENRYGVWNTESGISTAVKKRIKRVMWERVGILRDKDSLQRALKEFTQIAASNLSTSSRNFVTLATLVTTAALWREESRGGPFQDRFSPTSG
jgi:L-aspartate oxidase